MHQLVNAANAASDPPRDRMRLPSCLRDMADVMRPPPKPDHPTNDQNVAVQNSSTMAKILKIKEATDADKAHVSINAANRHFIISRGLSERVDTRCRQ